MASQDMKKKLEDECKKPGLKNWVGINTDIRVMKLNATWLNMDVSSKSFWHEFAMVRGCCWFCCWRFVPPSPNKVYRPWRDAISKAAVGLSGGLLEDATANHSFMAMQFRGRLIVLKHLNATDFHPQKSFVNTSSPMCWQICLVHSSEPWIGDPTGLKVETMMFAASSRSTFALKSLPRDRFWF